MDIFTAVVQPEARGEGHHDWTGHVNGQPLKPTVPVRVRAKRRRFASVIEMPSCTEFGQRPGAKGND